MLFKYPLSPGLLRMMRAFRVFRLFKRVESLRKIMQSLSRAVPGVANAFFIQVLVMSIYAILGPTASMNGFSRLMIPHILLYP